jgi:predicted transcriptional regulator
MEVHFTPEQEAEISRFARHAGVDNERFVQEAALRAVGEKQRWGVLVREGIEQAERGEFVEDDEVRLWLEQQEQRT